MSTSKEVGLGLNCGDKKAALACNEEKMENTESICIYCKQHKEVFNDEHVFPVSFGGTSKTLTKLVCQDCNSKFSRDFEGKFLKGSGVESFFRAIKGNKGRREYPIFGDGSYQNRVFVSVCSRFPPIQVLVSRNQISAPIQLIGVSESGNIFYSLLTRDEGRVELSDLLDTLSAECNKKEKCEQYFLWARDIDVSVAVYRSLRKMFFIWLGKNNYGGDFLCDEITAIPLKLDWDSVERNKMYSKLALNLFFWIFPERKICLLSNFDRVREYILNGTDADKSPVWQWTSQTNPIVNRIGLDYDLAVGLFIYNKYIYGAVYIPTIGMYIVNIGVSQNVPNQPIQSGIQEFNDGLCIFVSTKNGNPLFLVIERKICLLIKNDIVSQQCFIENAKIAY